MTHKTRLISRRSALIAIGAVAMAKAVMPSLAIAFDEKSTAAINLDESGVILHGYDAVAYFMQNTARKGSPQFQATHDGAIFYFATTENREAFLADPGRYVPQFGGFCAMGAALSKKLDGDPEVFRVVDDKLYLNVNSDIQKKWIQDIPGNITKANQAWPAIRDKAPLEIN